MKESNEIKQALGLGEEYLLPNGRTIKCVPCSLYEVDDAIDHWDVMLNSKYALRAYYFRGNQENEEIQKERASFEWLLIRASGRPVPSDENERKAMAKPLLEPFSVNDYSIVMDYFARFLGIIPRNAAPTGTEEREEQQQG